MVTRQIADSWAVANALSDRPNRPHAGAGWRVFDPPLDDLTVGHGHVASGRDRSAARTHTLDLPLTTTCPGATTLIDSNTLR